MLIEKRLTLYYRNFILITFFLCLPTAIIAKKNSDTLSFIQLTDVHLILSPANYHSDFIKGRYNYFWGDAEPFKQFFTSNSLLKKIDFLAITGDMIDFFEAESKSGELLGGQIEQFQQLLNSVTNLTVYMIPGNHDITSYPKGSYHQNRAAIARATWIKNTSSFANGTYYSRVFKVGTTTYRLIFLDNAYFSGRKNREQADFYIDRQQLDWLKAQLNESADDKEIIFMHMPLPFLSKNNNGDFEKISYEEYTKITNTENFLNTLKQAENSSVQMIVTGHIHRSEIHEFNFSEEFNFKQIVTGAFGNDINNWRLFELTNSEIIFSDPGTSNRKHIIPLK